MKTNFLFKLLLLSAMLLSAILGYVACDNHNPVPVPVPDPELEDSIEQPSSATFLFDISGSMKGYLQSSGDSRFLGVTTFFENIPSKIVFRLYGKKEGESIERAKFNRMLNDRSIKWSDESDLIAMVRSMKAHVDSGDHISFLLTDGILSGSDADIRNSPDRSYNKNMRQTMSENLSHLFSSPKDSLCVLIVRYKAKFRGPYSFYNNSSDSLDNKDRPFFIIAFGKWKYVKYVEQKLIEVKAANDGIATPYEDILMLGDACSYQKVKLSAAEGLNPKDGRLVIKKGYQKENIALSADLRQLPAYMQTLDYMKANIELYVKRASKKEEIAIDKDYYEISVDDAKKQLRISIKATQVKESDLIFKLKYAQPEWVETKSDDDDSDIKSNSSKLDKTFNLKYLVAGFKNIQKGKYIREQTLVIKN